MICTNEGIDEFIVYENFANFLSAEMYSSDSQFLGRVDKKCGVPGREGSGGSRGGDSKVK